MTGPVVVAGIDLSLTSTGVARVTADQDGGIWRTWQVASATRGRELAAQHARITDAAARVLAAVTADGYGPPDLAVIESPAYGKGPMAGAHDLAGLWWDVVGQILELGTPVAQVAPSSLKVYVVGHGGSPKNPVRKTHMRAAVERSYPSALTGGVHDVAEAVGLAAMGARHLGQSVDALPDVNLVAMAKAEWPNRIGE